MANFGKFSSDNENNSLGVLDWVFEHPFVSILPFSLIHNFWYNDEFARLAEAGDWLGCLLWIFIAWLGFAVIYVFVLAVTGALTMVSFYKRLGKFQGVYLVIVMIAMFALTCAERFKK